jgi:hypothetical protein
MSVVESLPEITDTELAAADARMEARWRCFQVVSAWYDRSADRVRLELANGLEVAFPPVLAQGLETATREELDELELTPSGLGLHFPRIDADVYVPALMQVVFGSRTWMAERLGRAGGVKSSPAKADAARANGRKGGRPRKRPAAGQA